jgi:hypothetical protein
MWSDDVRNAWVVDTVARWLRCQVPPEAEGRRNFRLVCVDPLLAEPLERRLRTDSEGTRNHWFVRSSSAWDAVRLRHGRPDGVRADACVGFVLLWSEGSAEADRNAQSLADIPAFDVADILAEPVSFELPAEAAIRERLEDAADAWSDDGIRARVRVHLVAAWNALRIALRLAPRKPGRSLRLVDSLEAWGAYLLRAQVSDEEWGAWPAEERAERLLARLGAALSALRLFGLPALASVLGVVSRPPIRPDSVARTGEQRWDRDLEELLLEDLQWASDHGALADAIAGKRSVDEQIDALVRRGEVKLRSSGDDGADALERFCHSGDESALDLVEWMFHEEASNRRSRSMGLHGLLIARGRGEARVDPIDRLAAETEIALGAELSTEEGAELRRLLDAHRRTREGRALLVGALTELAGGDRAELSPDWRQFVTHIALRSGHAPEDARALAGRWALIDAKEESDVVTAPSLLLGLVRLLAREEADLDGIGEGNELVLTLVEGEHADSVSRAFPVDGSLSVLLFRFLWDSVREAWASQAEGEDDEDEEAQESMSFAVARRRSRRTWKLGTIRLDWPVRERRARRNALGDVLRWYEADWKGEGRAPGGERLLRVVLEQGRVHAAGGFEALDAAWASYAAELGRDPHERAPGADVLELVAPAPPAARSWVDAWGALVKAAAGASAADRELRRKQELQAEFDAAFEREDMQTMKKLRAEMAALAPSTSGPALSIEDVRKLLRIETASLEADGQTARLLLTPHHPLVLRLRVLSDLVLTDVIRTLWLGQWPAVARDELTEFLAGWALPEPQHAYGVRGPEPLVFDGWVSGYAVYGRLDAGRETDAQTLGLRSVRDVLRRFAELFPTAADRLQLALQGDDVGRWAWGVVADRLGAGALRADLELVTPLPSREPTAFELEALASGDGLGAFEPGPDGEAPALRLRRVQPGSGATRAHLRLIVADRLKVFQASWGDDARPLDNLDPWDTRLLFYEPLPETVDYRVRAGEPPDTLSAAVSLAVARASNREAAFRETYNFDPAMAEPVLRTEQARADWLILVSRAPAYRAVQACAGIATLLDFSSRVEAGRVVHVSVSVGEDRREECGAALARACGDLLGGALISADYLLRRARALAPGLALRALGSQDIALEGLLGLLLTADEVGDAGRLVLSLDQHAQLLSGSGVLADLISLAAEDGCVRLYVAEAKFTLGTASPVAEPVPKAVRQLHSTVARLERFGASHPLAARTRAALVRAAVQQIHLLDRSVSEAERRSFEALVDAVADPGVPVVVVPVTDAVVHVWSWSDATRDGTDSSAGPTVFLHGRASTLRRLRELVGVELSE